jgi:outer membrane protein OmpA-like peptidoglycan-associated protein
MKRRWALGLVVGLWALLMAGAAWGQQLGFRVKDRVHSGQSPTLTLEPAEDLDAVEVKIKRADGKVQKAARKKLAEGEAWEIEVKQGEGKFAYVAEVVMLSSDGVQSTVTIPFEAVVAKPLALSLDRAGTDLDARVISLGVNAPVEKAEVIVHGEAGVLVERTQDLRALKPGERLTITWEAEAAVSKVELKVHDQVGFWVGFELIRIEVDIPHEEVNFDTGKATFSAEEAKKLDATLKAIAAELEKYQGYTTQVELNLYIGGYTDTVGDRAANQGLSEARAQAIGAYFRKKGLSAPIYFQGFGEDAPLVQTGDNVDEARNRRALYVLSNFTPPASAQLPRKNWKRLP